MKGTVRRRWATSAASSSVSSSSYNLCMSRGNPPLQNTARFPREARTRAGGHATATRPVAQPHPTHGVGIWRSRKAASPDPASSMEQGGRYLRADDQPPAASSISRYTPNKVRSQSERPTTSSRSSRHRQSSWRMPSSTPTPSRPSSRKRKITRAHTGTRLRTNSLQQVSLPCATGPHNHAVPCERRIRRQLQVLDRLLITRRQEAREYRAIGKPNTQRKLLHELNGTSGRLQPGPSTHPPGESGHVVVPRQHDGHQGHQASASSISCGGKPSAAPNITPTRYRQLGGGVDLADDRRPSPQRADPHPEHQRPQPMSTSRATAAAVIHHGTMPSQAASMNTVISSSLSAHGIQKLPELGGPVEALGEIPVQPV